MKLLMVGADSNYAIERFYFKYFSAMPMASQVSFFKAQNKFLTYYNQSLINKVWYRVGFSTVLKKINDELTSFIEEKSPDIIFVFKGMEILPQTLKWAKERKIKLVNYNPDNPFYFSGKGSGNRNITQSLTLYDLHFTYNQEVKNKIDKDFGIATAILPFGFELSEEEYSIAERQTEIIKTCFLGNPDAHRAKFIMTLAKKGVLIDVFGHNWKKFISHENITANDTVYGLDFWKTLRKYRVQLNLMRPHNLQSHNMRSFEIPAVGGVMLAPDTPDHQSFFDKRSEVFLFKSKDNCVHLIDVLLKKNTPEIDEIRKCARDRSIKSRYSYKDRCEQVVGQLIKL